ncbi:serine hydrolase domain-containing protein [Cellvibrio sp. ARAG 10.3]|uniref:serine hydrolase domain-containing protein n=1 Tax=Cellvibrio sp. ARAG 10.3 TaxID=3451358 RepID=UPI003F465A25
MLNTKYFQRLKTILASSLLSLTPLTLHAFELPGANIADNDRYDTLPPMIAEALAQLSTPASTTPAYITEFEQYIAQTVAPSVPGAALLVVADGKVQVMNGYGVRKVGTHDPVTPDTVFRLASVSKTIASAAAGLLVQENKLLWDSTVASTLSNVSFKNAQYGKLITVRDILAHTTGLPAHAYTNLIEARVPYEEAVKRLGTLDFICPPHRCYGYQNVVFSLIGDIIYAKSGESYENFVVNNLFRPLGMNSASFGLEALEQNRNYAQPHVWRRGQWKNVEINTNYYTVAPAAGANASIRDMASWMLAHLGQRPDVLPATTLDDMQAKIIKTSVAHSHYGAQKNMIDTYYGLGWRVFDFGAHKNFVHHGGWVQGYRAEMVFNRDLQIGMVFLTNSETRLARDVILNFVNLYEKHRQSEMTPQLLRADAKTH